MHAAFSPCLLVCGLRQLPRPRILAPLCFCLTMRQFSPKIAAILKSQVVPCFSFVCIGTTQRKKNRENRHILLWECYCKRAVLLEFIREFTFGCGQFWNHTCSHLKWRRLCCVSACTTLSVAKRENCQIDLKSQIVAKHWPSQGYK